MGSRGQQRAERCGIIGLRSRGGRARQEGTSVPILSRPGGGGYAGGAGARRVGHGGACTNLVGVMNVSGDRCDSSTVTVTGSKSEGEASEAMTQSMLSGVAKADNESAAFFQPVHRRPFFRRLSPVVSQRIVSRSARSGSSHRAGQRTALTERIAS
jgi:hypothetical protein